MGATFFEDWIAVTLHRAGGDRPGCERCRRVPADVFATGDSGRGGHSHWMCAACCRHVYRLTFLSAAWDGARWLVEATVVERGGISFDPDRVVDHAVLVRAWATAYGQHQPSSGRWARRHGGAVAAYEQVCSAGPADGLLDTVLATAYLADRPGSTVDAARRAARDWDRRSGWDWPPEA